MKRWSLAVGLITLGLLAVVSTASADRIPSQRVITQPSTGARTDITVPYTAPP
jgi:hypothetical protein